MKKKGILAMCLIIALCVSLCMVSFTASAAVTKNISFTDDFNRADIGEKWVASNGAKIDVERHAMRINECYDWNGNIILTKYKMTKSCVVEFTTTSFALGGWFSFAFGNATINSNFSSASGALLFTASPTGFTQLFTNSGASLGDNGDTPLNFSPFLSTKIGEDIAVKVEFIKQGSTNNYTINYSVTNVSDNSSIGTHTYTAEIKDGYFSFNTNNVGTDISNFTISEGAEKVFSDDFSNSTISYPSSNKDTIWKVPTAYTAKDVSVGAIASLDISKNGLARYVSPLAIKETDSGKAYSITFKLLAEKMTDGAITGVAIGMSEDSSGGAVVGLKKLADGYVIVCINGDKVQEGAKIATTDFSEPIDLQIIIYGDKDIDVVASGKKATFIGVATDGYLGVLSKCDGDNSLGGKVDDLALDTFVWESSQAVDVATNFCGVRETNENEMNYKEYYLSTNEWYYGSGASLPKYKQDHKNGYMQFINCNPFTAFGARNKYSDYTMRFDITLFDDVAGGVNDGVGFGISVGRPSLYMNCEKSQSISFAHFNGKTVVKGTNAIDEKGNVEKEVTDDGTITGKSHDFWKDKNITYNMMYVVKNGSVSVYFKQADEAEEKLDILRARYVGLNTYGYATIIGLNNAKFKVENFSLVNLDPSVAISTNIGGNHIENMRCDFSSQEYFSFVRKTEFSSAGAKILQGGKLTLNGDIKNMIMRIQLGKISGDFEVKLGSKHKIIFDEKAKTIRILGFSAYDKLITLPEGASLSDSTIEISVIGREFAISHVGSGKPLANLYEPKLSFGIGESYILPRTEVSYLVSSGEAILENFAVYNIDSFRTIKTRDFNYATDYVNHRTPKPLAPDATKIAIITCSVVGGVVIVAGVIVAIVVLRRRKKKNA